MVGGFEPKILICEDCSEEFVFTAAAQEYFAEKGYTEEPKRCKHCYMKYKREKRNNSGQHADDLVISPEVYSERTK
ncbi:MAG: zinc-ribbon domain-containing protein [Candidatus Zixiibacteriota bacterium]|nr:MAG: zinc-ribbon domain-containing protein [candidate division Zixibacteria bacterium]